MLQIVTLLLIVCRLTNSHVQQHVNDTYENIQVLWRNSMYQMECHLEIANAIGMWNITMFTTITIIASAMYQTNSEMQVANDSNKAYISKRNRRTRLNWMKVNCSKLACNIAKRIEAAIMKHKTCRKSKRITSKRRRIATSFRMENPGARRKSILAMTALFAMSAKADTQLHKHHNLCRKPHRKPHLHCPY